MGDFAMKMDGSDVNKTGFQKYDEKSICVCNVDNCDQIVYRNVLFDLMIDRFENGKDKKRTTHKFRPFTFAKIETHMEIHCGNAKKVAWSKFIALELLMSFCTLFMAVLIIVIEFFGYGPSRSRSLEEIRGDFSW